MTSVKLVTHKSDNDSRAIESGLQALGICYELICTEDYCECGARYGSADAPCLVIDDRVVYHGRLLKPDLVAIFSGVT